MKEVRQPAGSGHDDYELAVAWRRYVEDETRPRIGIAFGGGGARGMAHIGVLKSLEANGIPVDVVTGTSIGSFIGSLYASGAPVRTIEELGRQTNWSNLVELTLSKTGFFSTQRLENFINYHLGNPGLLKGILESPSESTGGANQIMFTDLKRPFACTATDLFTGEIIRFDTGPVAPAVRASCSIPGLFEPVSYDGRILVDGGVVLNLPVLLCRKLGAEIIIAVDLEKSAPDQISSLVQVLSQIIRIQGIALTKADRQSADFLIEPAVGSISMTDLQKTPTAIREGEIAGHLAARRIKENLLGNYRADKAPVADSSSPLMSSTDAARAIIKSLKPPSATATTAVSAAAYLRAAQAADTLGLYAEVIEYLGNVPDRERSDEKLRLWAHALIRSGDTIKASALVSQLSKITLNQDDRLRLAAAAIDMRMDELADSILAMIRTEH